MKIKFQKIYRKLAFIENSNVLFYEFLVKLNIVYLLLQNPDISVADYSENPASLGQKRCRFIGLAKGTGVLSGDVPVN